MKIAKRMILIAASGMLLAGAQAAPVQNVPQPERTIQAIPDQQPGKKLLPEEQIRIQQLQAQRNELLQKIQQKRIELLKNNPKLRRMYLQLLKQTRELAMELDANREMRLLNDDLNEVNRQLDREQKK